MKRLLIIILSLGILTGCGGNSEVELIEGNNGDGIINTIVNENNESNNNEDLEYPIEEDVHYDYEIEFDFPTLVNHSSNIAVVELISSEDFDEHTTIYHFKTINNIKGEIYNELFDYYSATEEFELEHKYVLFMEFYDSLFYENRVHLGVADYLLELDSEENIFKFYIHGKNIDEFTNLNELIDNINLVDEEMNINISDSGFPLYDVDNYNDLFRVSDNITEIRVIDINIDLPHVVFANCIVLNSYKGEIDKEITMFLFPSVKINKEYLVFLSEYNEGSYNLNSKMSIIPIEDSIEYEKAIIAIEAELIADEKQ